MSESSSYTETGSANVLWRVFEGALSLNSGIDRYVINVIFCCNPILFAVCTSTSSKLCKNMYTVACKRVLSSAPL
jgi:hypothetical protein